MMEWIILLTFVKDLPKSLVESLLRIEKDFAVPELFLEDVCSFLLVHNANHLHALHVRGIA